MQSSSQIESAEVSAAAVPVRPCRFCGRPLEHTVVDLGMSPLCESVRRPDDLDTPEVYYPLHVFVCSGCWLVQLREYVSPQDIFSEYAYFSSMSDSWLAHAKRYTELMIERLSLGAEDQVVEIASNDGYLLQHFVQRGIPALGIEPAANVARVARDRGVPSLVRFFGSDLARELVSQGTAARLLLGNNVLAHVPNLNDFVQGLKILLAEDGVVTMEFPHLQQLLENQQFDTIYHEHYSYLSLGVVQRVFEHHGLRLFDVEPLATHGGSLRIYATHRESTDHVERASVDRLLATEREAGLERLDTFTRFRSQVEQTKRDILSFFLQAQQQGKRVAGYGAPGKGVTLLHYCGIRSDFLEYTVDRNPYKQRTYVPGTGIPIYAPEHIGRTKPDYVFVLPWNLKEEILSQMAFIREWGGKFVIPIPQVEIL